MKDLGISSKQNERFLLYFLPTVTLPGAVNILTRVMRLAQRHLLDPMGRQRVEKKSSQTQAAPRQQSPATGRFCGSRTSASLTQAQVKLGDILL